MYSTKEIKRYLHFLWVNYRLKNVFLPGKEKTKVLMTHLVCRGMVTFVLSNKMLFGITMLLLLNYKYHLLLTNNSL